MKFPNIRRMLKGIGLPSIRGRNWLSALSRVWMSQTTVDYQREVGKVHLNEVVLPGINFIWKSALAATLILQVWSEKDQKWQRASPVQSQGPISVFTKKSAWSDWSSLMHRLVLGYNCPGDAFFYKVRSESGRVVTLQYLESDKLTASNSRNTNLPITHWEYQLPGGVAKLEVEDVLHVKYGADPESEVLGLSPLAATLRSIYIHNAASNWNASTLRNQGRPSAFVSPKPVDDIGSVIEQGDRIKEYLGEFRGDKVGEIAYLPVPVEFSVPGWKPTDVELLALSKMSREAILSALGVPGECLSWDTGNKTYNNVESADDAVGKRTVIPMLEDLARQFSEQMLGEFNLNPQVYRYAFDLSEAWWLIDETDKHHKRHRDNFMVGALSLGRLMELIGEKPTPADYKTTYFDLQARQNPEKTIAPKGVVVEKAGTKIAGSQTQHDRLLRRAKMRLTSLCVQLAASEITSFAFREKFSQVLGVFHADLYELGVKHAGGESDRDTAKQIAQQVVDLEQRFIDGLIDDVLGDRYHDADGKFDKKHGAFVQRMQWYASKGSATASHGWIDGSGDDEEFDWELGAVEDHCEDCPYLAENSPYTKETLYTVPRGFETPCKGNCACRLSRRSDGQKAFDPITW